DFSPSAVAMLGKALDENGFILLRRVEVRMDKRKTGGVPPPIEDLRIYLTPLLQALLLNTHWSKTAWVFGQKRRFKVIGERNDKMQRISLWPSAPDALPGVTRNPRQSAKSFLE